MEIVIVATKVYQKQKKVVATCRSGAFNTSIVWVLAPNHELAVVVGAGNLGYAIRYAAGFSPGPF